MDHSTLRRLLYGSALLVVVIVGVIAAAAFATTHGKNGRIAWKGFPQAGDFNWSAIYAANPDGSHRVQLTHPADGIVDDLPDWSPDGSKILFERMFQPDAPSCRRSQTRSCA